MPSSWRIEAVPADASLEGTLKVRGDLCFLIAAWRVWSKGNCILLLFQFVDVIRTPGNAWYLKHVHAFVAGMSLGNMRRTPRDQPITGALITGNASFVE